MLAAIPLFGSRVSPRCLFSETMIVARVEDAKIVSRRNHSIKDMSEDALLDELVDLGIDTLVCGGVDQAFIEDAETCGITVINNVAGEADAVLDALREGRLASGFGLSRAKEAPPARLQTDTPEIHCLRCEQRSCLHGKPCVLGPPPETRAADPAKLRIAEVAADVSGEDERKLCRVAELVHFALGMGYKRLGVAFCVDMFQEAEILCGVLSRFFEVAPVCCRIGQAAGEAHGADPAVSCCNVVGQAEALNRMHTDLNVMAGLCVGCDILFTGRSLAPATTLFVKDKSLANNPVGALYSRHYLEDLMAETENIQGGL